MARPAGLRMTVVMVVAVVMSCACSADAFVERSSANVAGPVGRHSLAAQRRARRGEPVGMIFDFFKDRANEGVEQLGNLASKTVQGKLGEALAETADYVTTRNDKFFEGLAKSRNQLMASLDSLLGVDMKLEETVRKLEDVLMSADIGTATTDDIIADLRRVAREDRLEADDVRSVLRGRLVQVLEDGCGDGDSTNSRALRFRDEGEANPTVFMMMGANGMGKTTTIGKLSRRLNDEGNCRVLLAACDTFRAAAADQLETWAERAEVEVVAAAFDGEKSTAVLERALLKARRGNFDVLIVDTSGRLANNLDLLDELQDMQKIVTNDLGRPPHETLLVMDASIGRNAIEQAKFWKDEVDVTGVIVTKLDGTARAGYVVGMTRDLQLPIKFIGVGEKIDDLRDFEPGPFVDALLGYDEEASRQLQQRLDKQMFSRPQQDERAARPPRPNFDPFEDVPVGMTARLAPDAPQGMMGGNPRAKKSKKKGKGKKKGRR